MATIGESEAKTLLAAATNWAGGGWTTSRASRALYSLTSVPLVSADFSQYKNSWFYALSFFWNVSIDTFDLTDRAAEAAFQLVNALQGAQQEPQDEEMEEDDDECVESTGQLIMPWDTPVHELDPMFMAIWKQVGEGHRQTEFRTLLQDVPQFRGLPLKAATNNHCKDGMRHWDRTCKA